MTLIKLGHVRPGDAVRVRDPQTGEVKGPLYIVAVFNAPGKRAFRPGQPHGLYDDQRPLFLVNLETGEAEPMPHLSSLVFLVSDAVVTEGGT